MNEIKPTYTERTAMAIEGMASRLLTEAGRNKFIFEVDRISGDFKLTNMENDASVTYAEIDLSLESVLVVCGTLQIHLRDMIIELLVKEFLE